MLWNFCYYRYLLKKYAKSKPICECFIDKKSSFLFSNHLSKLKQLCSHNYSQQLKNFNVHLQATLVAKIVLQSFFRQASTIRFRECLVLSRYLRTALQCYERDMDELRDRGTFLLSKAEKFRHQATFHKAISSLNKIS